MAEPQRDQAPNAMYEIRNGLGMLKKSYAILPMLPYKEGGSAWKAIVTSVEVGGTHEKKPTLFTIVHGLAPHHTNIVDAYQETLAKGEPRHSLLALSDKPVLLRLESDENGGQNGDLAVLSADIIFAPNSQIHIPEALELGTALLKAGNMIDPPFGKPYAKFSLNIGRADPYCFNSWSIDIAHDGRTYATRELLYR